MQACPQAQAQKKQSLPGIKAWIKIRHESTDAERTEETVSPLHGLKRKNTIRFLHVYTTILVQL
jgi:hypothetical protein